MALLEIKNLVKNYGDVEALKGINLSIEKGEVVVILGPSGCGKSTFLRCLNGLEEIKRGQILLQNAGELGKDIPWVKARQRIGMVCGCSIVRQIPRARLRRAVGTGE